MTTLFQSLFTIAVTSAHRVEDHMRSLSRDERGASAVEYALLVGAIAAAVIAGVAILGPRLTDMLGNILPRRIRGVTVDVIWTRTAVVPPTRLRG